MRGRRLLVMPFDHRSQAIFDKLRNQDRLDVSKPPPCEIPGEHRAAKLVMPIRRFVGCLFQIDVVDELTEIIVNDLFRPKPKPNLCFLVSFLCAGLSAGSCRWQGAAVGDTLNLELVVIDTTALSYSHSLPLFCASGLHPIRGTGRITTELGRRKGFIDSPPSRALAAYLLACADAFSVVLTFSPRPEPQTDRTESDNLDRNTVRGIRSSGLEPFRSTYRRIPGNSRRDKRTR